MKYDPENPLHVAIYGIVNQRGAIVLTITRDRRKAFRGYDFGGDCTISQAGEVKTLRYACKGRQVFMAGHRANLVR